MSCFHCSWLPTPESRSLTHHPSVPIAQVNQMLPHKPFVSPEPSSLNCGLALKFCFFLVFKGLGLLCPFSLPLFLYSVASSLAQRSAAAWRLVRRFSLPCRNASRGLRFSVGGGGGGGASEGVCRWLKGYDGGGSSALHVAVHPKSQEQI